MLSGTKEVKCTVLHCYTLSAWLTPLLCNAVDSNIKTNAKNREVLYWMTGDYNFS